MHVFNRAEGGVLLSPLESSPCELAGRMSLVQTTRILNTLKHKSTLCAIINTYDNNELHVTIIKTIIFAVIN